MASDLFQYVQKTKNLSFQKLPFHSVDSLILSCLSYLPFQNEEVRPWKKGWKKDCFSLKEKIQKSHRFSFSIGYPIEKKDPQIEKQFAAVCYIFDDFNYVCFRGTDATLTGWKEDFNLCFMEEIPAQQEAKKYLEKIFQLFPKKKCFVGGHSKGGNLAIYASAHQKEENQIFIEKIFCHDGPSFLPRFFEEKGYASIKNKIDKTIPESSIIGLLFHKDEYYTVIKSSSYSLFQHNPFSWEIENFDFISCSSVKEIYLKINHIINTYIFSLEKEERQELVDFFFLLIQKTQSKNKRKEKGLSSWFLSFAETIKEIRSDVSEEKEKRIQKNVLKLMNIIKKEKECFSTLEKESK